MLSKGHLKNTNDLLKKLQQIDYQYFTTSKGQKVKKSWEKYFKNGLFILRGAYL